jgi:fucose 4-O-acetylase-like acetyltransferase
VNNRIEWLDTAKGFGIFFVVVGHALSVDATISTVIWSFHMPLFFFLSGITAKSFTAGSMRSTVRGLKNIFTPYLFFSILSIIFWAISHGKITSGEIWRNLLYQMAYGVAGLEAGMQYNIPLWFFTCLFSVRFLFALVTAMTQSKYHQVFLVTSASIAAYFYVLPRYYSFFWNLDVAPIALVFYTAGYILQKEKLMDKLLAVPSRWAVLLSALLIFIISVGLNGRVDMNGRAFGNLLLFFSGAFSGILLMLEASKRYAAIVFLRSLGKASIVIFPTHLLLSNLPYRIIPTLNWYTFRITHSEIIAAVTTAIIEITVCLPIYAAILRWAPFLIVQYKNKNFSSAMTRNATVNKTTKIVI